MTTTYDAAPAPRFEAVRLTEKYGWTVADLVCGTAIAPMRTWDGPTAVAVMAALNGTPAYTAMFRWFELDAYPIVRLRVLVAPLFATSLDGSARTDLPPGTIYTADTAADGDGLVQISEIAPYDPASDPRRWLVDVRDLRKAAEGVGR